jgi:hypothetical protein
MFERAIAADAITKFSPDGYVTDIEQGDSLLPNTAIRLWTWPTAILVRQQ